MPLRSAVFLRAEKRGGNNPAAGLPAFPGKRSAAGQGWGALLANERSTFLRRHAGDPVEWHPWGAEAMQKAARENKLLLVSMGYTTCPWSARMQRDSFQNPEVARFMNRHFVNVLVDREERPDISGGWLQYTIWRKIPPAWPLHVWITPKGLPLYNGTYYASAAAGTKSSWSDIIEYVATQWANEEAHILKQAEVSAREYGREIRGLWKSGGAGIPVNAGSMAYERLRSGYDPVNGGFTGVPKFPRPHLLTFLMDYADSVKQNRFGRGGEAMEMVTTTLDRILRGGIVDQLDGGVFRYSTDVTWTVPQFEKMLFDQAFMADVLIRAGLKSGRDDFTEAGRRMLRYAQSALGHPDGGFFCAEGAGAPTGAGEERAGSGGAGFAWRLEDIRGIAAPEALPLLTAVFALEEGGNVPFDSPRRKEFDGLNLLVRKRPVETVAAELGLDPGAARTLFDNASARLLAARGERLQAVTDRKILAGWNGLMISSLARAGRALDEESFTRRAEQALEFVLKQLRKPDGALRHAWLDAPSSAPACSEDYSLLIQGLLDLYETTGNIERLKLAAGLQDRQIADLWDAENGGFFDGPAEGMVLERGKSVDEGTELAPGAVSAMNLGRLAAMLNRGDFAEKLKICRDTGGALAARGPALFLRFLAACELVETPPLQIIITGAPDAPDRKAMLRALRLPPPEPVVFLHLEGAEGQMWLEEQIPGLKTLPKAASGRTAAHLCRNFQLLETLTDPAAVEAWLRRPATTANR